MQMSLARSFLSVFACVVIMCGAARAEESADLTEQAVMALHPAYVPAAEMPDKVATIDRNLFLMSDPTFRPCASAAAANLAYASFGPAQYFILALAERDQREESVSFDVEVGLFGLRDGKLTLIATGNISDPELVVEDAYLAGVDIAPDLYRINDHEVAIGVLLQSAYNSTALHVTGQTLYLLRPQTEALIPIFIAPFGQSTPTDSTDELIKPNLSVSSHKTRDFYDLKLKDGNLTTQFVWSGSYYENPEALSEYGDQN